MNLVQYKESRIAIAEIAENHLEVKLLKSMNPEELCDWDSAKIRDKVHALDVKLANLPITSVVRYNKILEEIKELTAFYKELNRGKQR